MMNKIKNALKNNKGFTLIELIIVIAVVVLLAAITVPSYLNVLESAKEAEVTSAARNAYLNVMVDYTQYQVDLASDSSATVPSYADNAAAALSITSPDTITVTPNSDGTFEVEVTIDDYVATCDASGVTYTGKGTIT